MDYNAKYMKYKKKNLNLLKVKMNGGFLKMYGGSLSDLKRQIPENFLTQKTITPAYYKYLSGAQVVRATIPTGQELWNVSCSTEIPEYTSPVVIYHDILQRDQWNPDNNIDENHKEFDPRERKMKSGIKRGGWADPVDINIIVPRTSSKPADFDTINERLTSEGKTTIKEPKKRWVDWSTKDEIMFCQYSIDNCMATYSDGTPESRYLESINDTAKICTTLGIKMRFSYTGPIKFDSDGYPLNPIGRTGLRGRGTLGNWGPNHAADPVVCRKDPVTKNLQFVLVKRLDTGDWALPGGMVEAGQTIAGTRTREFAEEALAIDETQTGELAEQRKQRVHDLEQKLKGVFGHPSPEDILYQGVSDDPRNTDQSWMETTAILTIFTGEFENLELKAGDDAGKVKWANYRKGMKLFASHKLFIDLAVEKLLNKGLIVEKEDGYEFV